VLVPHAIQHRIQQRGPGAVFTAADFSDLGERPAIDQALSRMARRGLIRRLDRGLYDLPATHPRVGALWPSADAVAHALAGRTDAVLQPSGAAAANALGLTTQVPARVEFLTDGPSRHVRVGKLEVHLRRGGRLDLLLPGSRAGMALLALRHLGRAAVDEGVRANLARVLTDEDMRLLLTVRKQLPGWLARVVGQLSSECGA
jgi:hypothetical protein